MNAEAFDPTKGAAGFESSAGYRGSLVPPRAPRKPREPRAKVVPIALRRGEPVAVVTAIVRYVDALRAERSKRRNPDYWLNLTTDEVIMRIGLTIENRLPGAGSSALDALCLATLEALGFKRTTHYGERVMTLPPESTLSKLQGFMNATAPERRSFNSGPTKTVDIAQTRLAAQRAQSGNVDT